jgi:hypothetical protein
MFGRRKKNENSSASDVAEALVTGNQAEAYQNDAQLIAVIAAAIAASLGTSSNGIVIRSLKRSRSNTPKWGAEGRAGQIYHQF